ncbi:unnamed protein product, partial [Ascophyllum nodosum]
MRSRRESRVWTEGRDRGSQNWPYITLLRAGCQRLSVQRLYDVEKTEHGDALESTGGENSELSSVGTSECGSGDDGETVSFEVLLAKEGRRSASRIATSPSFSSSSSPASREKTAFLRRWSCSPRVQTSKPSTCHNPEDSARSVDDATTGSNQDLTAAVPSTIAGKDGIESVSLPFSASSSRKEDCEQPSTNKAPNPKRSAGAQYSGPPVDQGVQTTALRLPRSNDVRYRVLKARYITPPDRSPPPKTLPGQEDRETPPQPEATKLEPMEAAPAEVAPRKQADTFGTLLKPKVQGSIGAKWAPVHLRLNMDEIQDADLGQRPTVWAAGGGAVVPGRDFTTQSFSRIVERADVQGGSVSKVVNVKGGDTTATPPLAESLRAPSQEPKRCALGDGALVQNDNYTRELDKRECPLDLVSKGMGSLGERLANVGAYMDRLEQDMNHDREVVEIYHKQVVNENEAAARDLRDALARRRASHSACTVDVTKVPFWRSRMGTSDDAVPAGHDPNRGETVRGKEGRHHVPDYDGEGGGGVDAALDANEAVIASENELREAR